MSSSFNNISYDEFLMSCSEASLPGASLNTQEITDDRHGVTERNAYRRMYDDRIDLIQIPFNILDKLLCNVCITRVDLPPPETPVTHVNIPRGNSTSMS